MWNVLGIKKKKKFQIVDNLILICFESVKFVIGVHTFFHSFLILLVLSS